MHTEWKFREGGMWCFSKVGAHNIVNYFRGGGKVNPYCILMNFYLKVLQNATALRPSTWIFPKCTIYLPINPCNKSEGLKIKIYFNRFRNKTIRHLFKLHISIYIVYFTVQHDCRPLQSRYTVPFNVQLQ